MPEGPAPQSERSPLVELADLMTRLRAECAWKAGQTHRSLARYLLEETHETLEAIDEGELTGDWAHLREELGDLLLQVYFHAAIAAERGEFTIDDVAADLREKLIRRNPHVFGDPDQRTNDPVAINEAWENIKRAEKRRDHPAEGLPTSLPALLYADKVIDRMGRAGTPVVSPTTADPPSSGTRPDLGDRLLALAVEAHASGIDAEQALRDAVRRVVEDPRFRQKG